jgi:PPOX class probable F420-dependent enzyme
MTAESALTDLAAHTHVLLTTFRRDGTPVATPVWVVSDGADVLVITGARTGKVARVRHTPAVLLAPCDGRGRRLAGHHQVAATAVLLTGDADVRRVRSLIRARYGLRYGVATALLRLRGGRGAEVGIRITSRG